ncbi:MAG: YihY family inner membrane protein [Alphaproteobacteria bacterium]|nr:YihY family inner membrane protein [Alphaproteobacteria bacterium]
MTTLLARLERALLTQTDVPEWLVPVHKPARWLWVFYRALSRDRVFVQAAGMAYISLVALVPLLLLVFSVLGATGVLEANQPAIEALVFESFLGDIHEVRDILVPGLEAANVGALGIVGVAGLLLMSWRLFVMIEQAYNGIFGVRTTRALHYRMLLFYVGITMVPVVFVLSFLRASQFLSGLAPGFGRTVVLALMELVVLSAAIRGFPSTPVRWRSAVVGGTVSVVLMHVISAGFQLYVSLFTSTDPVRVIYGSLAALPVFLMWLYLVWVAILVGVETAAVMQDYRTLLDAESAALHEEVYGRRDPGLDVALFVTAVVGQHWDSGLGPAPAHLLAERAGMSEKVLSTVLASLQARGLLLEVPTGFVLARPADHLKLRDIVDAWRAADLPFAGHGPELNRIRAELDGSLEGTLEQARRRWLDVDPTLGTDAPADTPPA